jgi:hypothetical protein
MSSGPEGQQLPSPRGRIYDGICSDSCVIQDPLTWQAGPYMTMPIGILLSLSECEGEGQASLIMRQERCLSCMT